MQYPHVLVCFALVPLATSAVAECLKSNVEGQSAQGQLAIGRARDANSEGLPSRDRRRGSRNVIEWYDFYIFGSLATVLSVKFFEKSHPVAALLSTIALFTAGFLIRPLGAFLFGWMGDRIGRKYTFLVTLSGIVIARYFRNENCAMSLTWNSAPVPKESSWSAVHSK